MDGSELNTVVDKVAEKIGMAAEKLAPIAEEVVRQVQARELFQGIVFAAGFILFAGYALHCARHARAEFAACQDIEKCAGWVIPAIASAFLALFSVPPAIISFSRYLAPLPYLLGK